MSHITDTLSRPIEGFKEQEYLYMNPDVQEAVEKGGFSSGWNHFMLCGYRESREGVSAEVYARLQRQDAIIGDFELPVSGFDEAAYLRLNPDIRDIVAQGKLPSGWHHFMTNGYREKRKGVPAKVYKSLNGVLDVDRANFVPPKHLRHRVHGSEDPVSFERLGRKVANGIDYAKFLAGCTLADNAKILDFGCGCGRVIRYFKPFHENCEYFGTDIDGEAIAWCQKNLQDIAKFSVNKETPPLPFADGFFDLVYSISIFTHLPEDMQFAWLEELRRITKKGGYLFLTVHGDNLFPSQFEKQMKYGFYYSVGSGTEGLPDFYQTAFHTEKYIRQHWKKYFSIEKIIQFPTADIQQTFILCKQVK
jgi:SAM-dependent methyltransferase